MAGNINISFIEGALLAFLLALLCYFRQTRTGSTRLEERTQEGLNVILAKLVNAF